MKSICLFFICYSLSFIISAQTFKDKIYEITHPNYSYKGIDVINDKKVIDEMQVFEYKYDKRSKTTNYIPEKRSLNKSITIKYLNSNVIDYNEKKNYDVDGYYEEFNYSFSYDSINNLKKITKSNPKEIEKFVYSENIVEIFIFSPRDTVNHKGIIKYRLKDNGLIESETTHNGYGRSNGGNFYEYNEKNDVIKLDSYGVHVETIYEYDEYGNIISEMASTSNDLNDNVTNSKAKFFYDSKNLLQKKVYGIRLHNTILYTYENGNLVKTQHFYEDTQMSYELLEYDSYGNWIKKSTFSLFNGPKNLVLDALIIREIKYK
ncbi:hypothetical protein [Winogradskyella sp. MH6]|uniref:hypothetical protein n=1 Tax=Winogradskyella sp. MH6 TaxID=2929510 RepID=UPI001FB1D471|nr:hypothetical protein [Winogradskyella sp. MH6]